MKLITVSPHSSVGFHLKHKKQFALTGCTARVTSFDCPQQISKLESDTYLKLFGDTVEFISVR